MATGLCREYHEAGTNLIIGMINSRNNQQEALYAGQLISRIVSGQFDDGGDKRSFSWGLLHPAFQSISGGPRDVVYPWHQGVEHSNLSMAEPVTHFRIYSRALLTAETIAVLGSLVSDLRRFKSPGGVGG